VGGTQLPLAIDAPEPGRRLPARIRPMQATPAGRPFDDPDYLFEPWWLGSRVIVFVEDGTMRLQAEQLADPLEALPELAAIPGELREQPAIMDGTLVVLDRHGRPDHDLMRERLNGTARDGRPAFIAADLLHLGDDDLSVRPFRERRELLKRLIRQGDTCVVSRGFPAEGVTVGAAMAEMGLEAISARRFDARYRPGPAGEAWLRLPLAEPVGPRGRPSLSLIQKLPL
jgi:bifunctional non-homologous end joining protein LigD